MSLSSRISSVKRLIQEFRKWPEDSNKIYPSFKEAQIKKYEDGLTTSTKLSNSEVLDQQYDATKLILEGFNKSRFPVSSKLLQPNGMPSYYERILNEAQRGGKKVSYFQGLKDTYFGWWK